MAAADFTGTSMATPHIAGGAAVLLQLHEDWTPAQIKSALVNRADLVVKDAITGTHDVGPTLQGGGRENLSVAADATTWLDPVSASFGRVITAIQTRLRSHCPTRLAVTKRSASLLRSLRRTPSVERSRLSGMLEP